tara:strand:- start:108 stop:746 length:639 start_codon:yes stop_codon:yes gene_type:complete
MGLAKKIANVSELKPMKDNVKKHPAWQIERLVYSISTYSSTEPKLLQPLVVDEKDVVMIGNGRLEAIKQLGWNKVEVIVKDGLSNDQKKALSILDNKSISTEWNEEILVKQLPELSQKSIETGFTEKEIHDLLKKSTDILAGADTEPVYDLTPKLYEKYDYIMLFFDNEVDFLYVSQLLKLKKMRDRMKPDKVGLYRAIKGMDAIELLKKAQ